MPRLVDGAKILIVQGGLFEKASNGQREHVRLVSSTVFTEAVPCCRLQAKALANHLHELNVSVLLFGGTVPLFAMMNFARRGLCVLHTVRKVTRLWFNACRVLPIACYQDLLMRVSVAVGATVLHSSALANFARVDLADTCGSAEKVRVEEHGNRLFTCFSGFARSTPCTIGTNALSFVA